MRLDLRFFLPSAVFATLAGAGPVVAAPLAPAPRGCEAASPGGASRVLASKANALALLGSVTRLTAPRGRPVLDSNLAATIAINNQATPALRAQALIDAQITDENANVLADGLGGTMGGAYRRKAFYRSHDDGSTLEIGEIGSAVSALIGAVNKTAGGDSAEGKCAFANGVEPYQGGRWVPPPGGTFDVFGKAYGHPPGSDRFGNSRPFQIAPLDATSGPRIETYAGKDFFGVATNSRLMLVGPTPADVAAGRTGSNLIDNPAYPSGHTTFGYTESLILAMMVPERLRALAYRGSEYGHSRIVIGAHYPLDVIAGRTLATYDLAQGLAGTAGYAQGPAGTSLKSALAAAAAELRAYLRDNGCPSLAACAGEPIVRAENAGVLAQGGPRPATPAAAYAFRLTYDLAPLGATDAPPEPVPPEAATLLATRFPYLTAAQRLDVLMTTEGPSGHFLDGDAVAGKPFFVGRLGAADQAGVYSRLDLFAAAGGYRDFSKDVVIDQDADRVKDPDLAPFADFAQADTWTNDIAGPGGLIKQGRGMLTLAGASTYDGPTRAEAGLLDIAGSIRSPVEVGTGGTLGGAGRVGDVAVVAGGTLAPGAPDGGGALEVAGSLTLNPGSRLALHSGGGDAKLKVAGKTTIEGAVLVLREGGALKPGASLTLIEAKGGVTGTFAKVQALSPSLVPNLTYSAKAVYLTLDDAPAPRKATP